MQGPPMLVCVHWLYSEVLCSAKTHFHKGSGSLNLCIEYKFNHELAFLHEQKLYLL